MYRRRKIHKVTVGDYVIRGTKEAIIERCEKLADRASVDKNERRAERFKQAAEHFRKLEE